MTFIVESNDYFELPVNYNILAPWQRRRVREQYVKKQDGKCSYCNEPLSGKAHDDVMSKKINTRLFPESFFNYPIHLHHDHWSGMTIGAVHCHCNAVLWQYHGE